MNFTAVMVVEPASPNSASGSRGEPVAALAHVANRPILHHALDALTHSAFDGLIVVGDADDLIDIRACLRDYSGALGDVEYAIRRDGSGITGTLQSVVGLVGDSPCLMQPADGLLEVPVDALLRLVDDGESDLVLFAPPSGPSAREWRAPALSTATRTAPIPDFGVFSRGALRRINAAPATLGRPDLATIGLHVAADGASIRIQSLDGWRRYRGSRGELLEVNRVALDRVTPSVPEAISRGNRIEGRVVIDPSARVHDSMLVGPTVVGPGAVITEAYIGPYTSIGAGAHIEGAEIERSIVGEDASVLHVGTRLSGSVIGRNARVHRDFGLPRALRLWVGNDDEIALP